MKFFQLLTALREAAANVDHRGQWPGEQLQWLAETGVLRWGLPLELGGSPCSQREYLERYIDLAAACLTTTFILTQRNGACQRLAASPNKKLQQQLLPPLMSGERFATVGISHLTTSRQHLGRPAVEVLETQDGYVLQGTIPWVTGAIHADELIVGGTLADGRQILAAVPRNAAGVTVAPHAQLLALTGSYTACVHLNRVALGASQLVAGPVTGVMQQGSGGGAGSLATSALALGVSCRCLDLLRQETEQRRDLRPTLEAFQQEFDNVRALLLAAVEPGPGEQLVPIPTTQVRQQANSLVSRISQSLLAVSKGAGFVQGHPAELAVREAMFFLVWSCPQPVLNAALQELACIDN